VIGYQHFRGPCCVHLHRMCSTHSTPLHGRYLFSSGAMNTDTQQLCHH
jgi:hypothetical protein